MASKQNADKPQRKRTQRFKSLSDFGLRSENLALHGSEFFYEAYTRVENVYLRNEGNVACRMGITPQASPPVIASQLSRVDERYTHSLSLQSPHYEQTSIPFARSDGPTLEHVLDVLCHPFTKPRRTSEKNHF